MKWITNYAQAAKGTDRIAAKANHPELLALGLMGEAGSMLAELKKERREEKAYPAYRHRMVEESGDFLWYLIRLITVCDAALLPILRLPVVRKVQDNDARIGLYSEFGNSVGQVLITVQQRKKDVSELRAAFIQTWNLFTEICRVKGVKLNAAADQNIRKAQSRWPKSRVHMEFFDETLGEEEQLPRLLEIEFREQPGPQKAVVLRFNGLNFGDRLTDNITDPDGYRYHDVFHFAYAVHLGWSPVTRKLLRLKRKSSPRLDEGEDGARAGIIEEAVSAIVFSRAKHLNYFKGINKVDYDLLKMVKEFVEGFEAERIPLWQWEEAILDGFRLFRELRDNLGGRISLDMRARKIAYTSPVTRSPRR